MVEKQRLEDIKYFVKRIISRESFDFPETNADTFRIQAKENIISEERLSPYILWLNFVIWLYLYDKIDEQVIYNIVQNHLSDFDYFIEKVVDKYLIEITKKVKGKNK